MGIRKFASYARIGFGLALLLGLIWYFDAASIMRPFADLQLPWVLGSALLIVCATLIGAFNRHLLIDLEGKIPFIAFLPLYWVAWAMGLVIPGQIGEVAALSAMLRRKGLQWQESLGRSLLDKLISFSLMLMAGLGGLLLVAVPESSRALTIAMLAGLSLFMAVLTILVFSNRERLARYFSHKTSALAGLIGDTSREFLAASIHHPSRVLLNAALTLVGIGFIGTAYWCVFVALGYTEIPFGKLILLVAACSIVAYVPVSFNGIGTVEVTGIMLFGLLGIPAAGVLSAYLCLRLIVMLLAWLPAATILVLRAPAISSKTS